MDFALLNNQELKQTYSVSFEQTDVEMFSHLTGDTNPIHLDEKYAQDTIFGKPIVHGFLVGSVLSRIFGTEYPGLGTIYLKQDLLFKAPVYVEQYYLVEIIVIKIYSEKSRADLQTNIYDDTGKLVLQGSALVQHNIFREI